MTTNVFPLTFQSHIIFCAIAVAFFIFQYVRLKHSYYIMTVFAILATLALYINDSRMLFYGIGIFELVMLVAIAVSAARTKRRQAKLAAETQAAGDNNENSNT